MRRVSLGIRMRAIERRGVGRTAVTRGCDFILNELRYQVKANRPSGKRGSFVTLVGKASNYDWDRLILDVL